MLLKKAEKRELRMHYRHIRSRLDVNLKEELDLRLAERFLTSRQYAECKTLLTYVSREDEVDTSLIISSALLDGKKVAVPKCSDKDGNMEFYFITELSQLKTGMFSILEPDLSVCKRVEDFDNAICLAPALACDKNGYRLGYGGGYYDRFLSSFGKAKIGLVYERCFCRSLPVDKFDVPLDMVITEKSTYLRKH